MYELSASLSLRHDDMAILPERRITILYSFARWRSLNGSHAYLSQVYAGMHPMEKFLVLFQQAIGQVLGLSQHKDGLGNQ